MNELLKLQNISKTFRKNKIDALKNISFECAKGDVISIVGSSGSGKSTLLRIIAGLEIPGWCRKCLPVRRECLSAGFLPPFTPFSLIVCLLLRLMMLMVVYVEDYRLYFKSDSGV